VTHTTGSSSFSKAFKELFAVYAFDLVGLLAGFLIANQLGIFRAAPWVLALYPAVLGAKSVIDGLLSGRLSTSLHLGTVHARFFQNTKSFRRLIEAIIFLTLVMSLAMSAISIVFGQIFWGIGVADFPSILAVVSGTMSMGLVLLAVTAKVAFISFNRALDPDTTVYPVMSTVSSIFITLCYVVIINLFFNFGNIGIGAVAILGFVNLFFAFFTLSKNLLNKEFVEIIRESIAALLTIALIVNMTGTILKGVDRILGSQTKFYTSVIYTVYPVFIGLVSDFASVVGSLATTKLALGMLRPNLSSIVQHAKSVVSAWLVSIVMFTISIFVALLINGDFTVGNFSKIIPLAIVGNFIAIALTVLLSHLLSILIFQKGLDPGNFVIPIENALAASITSLALLAAMVLLSVG
jgi:cation transporter-like permease